eukprot:scaffold27600_cov124-Isochrysis_galbana.AAC.2
MGSRAASSSCRVLTRAWTLPAAPASPGQRRLGHAVGKQPSADDVETRVRVMASTFARPAHARSTSATAGAPVCVCVPSCSTTSGASLATVAGLGARSFHRPHAHCRCVRGGLRTSTQRSNRGGLDRLHSARIPHHAPEGRGATLTPVSPASPSPERHWQSVWLAGRSSAGSMLEMKGPISSRW